MLGVCLNKAGIEHSPKLTGKTHNFYENGPSF